METNNKKHQPSAFPLEGYDSGMTLRDYFAAQAIQSIQIPTKISLDIGNWTVENSNNFAKVAYQIADEMMKARDE